MGRGNELLWEQRPSVTCCSSWLLHNQSRQQNGARPPEKILHLNLRQIYWGKGWYRSLGAVLCLSKTRGGWGGRNPNRTRRTPNKVTAVDLGVFLWRAEMPTWTACDLWEWTVGWKAAHLTGIMFSVCTFLKNTAQNITCRVLRAKFLTIAHLIKWIISIWVEMFLILSYLNHHWPVASAKQKEKHMVILTHLGLPALSSTWTSSGRSPQLQHLQVIRKLFFSDFNSSLCTVCHLICLLFQEKSCTI